MIKGHAESEKYKDKAKSFWLIPPDEFSIADAFFIQQRDIIPYASENGKTNGRLD
jgi:hypothetical protein